MDINQIIELIHTLNELYQPMAQQAHLRDRVLLEFFKQTLSRLEAIVRQIREERSSLASGLDGFIGDYWALVNGTILSPTAMPQAELTMLLCEIADIVVHEKNMSLVDGEIPLMAIKWLMPTIATESFHDDYPNLSPHLNLQLILETHVLGFNGLYLLPIKLLTELNLTAESTRLFNPYYDHALHPPECAFVNTNEFERLVNHSPLTRALVDAKNDYDRLTNDTGHLLGQLRQLCQKLSANSASGAGSERHAGCGVYPAIITFMEYYHQIEEPTKEKIPGSLRAEVETLLGLVTDVTTNVNATETMETCIATRRSKLIEGMIGHDSELAQVSVSRATNHLLIDEARTRFERAKVELIKLFSLHQYTNGRDALGLQPRLFDALQMFLGVLSLDDLGLFQELTVSELDDFLSLATLRHQIFEHIVSIDILYGFIVGLAPDKLEVFLTCVSHELMGHLIISSKELTELLMLLRVEKCQIVCKTLSDKFRLVIQSGQDACKLMESLSDAPRTVFFEAIKQSLPGIIKSAADFFYVLKPLSRAQRVMVYELMIDDLMAMMRSTEDCRTIFYYLFHGAEPVYRSLLKFIERMHFSEDAKAFAIVLVGQDPEQIRVKFDRLIIQGHRPSRGFLAFFRPHNSMAELITTVTGLSPKWIAKLNRALGLNLEEIQFNSQKAIKAALTAYINAQEQHAMLSSSAC